ncbi:MAG: hypothetical protein JW958_02610 [Candidatus Eisenbacteria bacterium]|nr:hypothetical protein [Candidatus Eisenbacteria bacterium]
MLAAVLLLWALHPERLPSRIEQAHRIGEGLRAAHLRIGRWLREDFPPETVIAVLDTGAIPYVSRLHAIDIANVPLNNRRLAMGEYTRVDFWKDDPDLIIVREDAEGRLAFHPVRKVLIEDAVRKNYRGIRHAKYGEDYFLTVLAKPDAIPRKP